MNYVLAFVVKDFPGIVIAEEPAWKDCIQGSNGVVNLAGLPISTRWSSEVSITYSYNVLFSYYRASSGNSPGAIVNRVPLEACVEACNEGNEIICEASKWPFTF